jgi:hypothetical protein
MRKLPECNTVPLNTVQYLFFTSFNRGLVSVHIPSSVHIYPFVLYFFIFAEFCVIAAAVIVRLFDPLFFRRLF